MSKKSTKYVDQTKQPGYEDRKLRSRITYNLRKIIINNLMLEQPELFEKLKAGAEFEVEKLERERAEK